MPHLPARIARDLKAYRLPLLLCLPVLILLQLAFGTICLLRAAIGVPCPACGLTRATLLLASGHPFLSFHMHPLLILVIMGVLYAFYTRYLSKGRGILSCKGVKIYVILCLSTFIIFYLIRMSLFFPGHPPMDYHDGNMLNRVVHAVQGTHSDDDGGL